jgi:hypothetical protein
LTDQDLSADDIASAAEQTREWLQHGQQSRDEQPTRLAQARTQAETERKGALAAEPWDELLSAVPTYGPDGELTGMLALPSIDGKELFGTRLAFDLLGCCDDEDQVADTVDGYFSMVKEPDHLFLVAFAALKVIANHVMPQMLEVIEDQASNWDVRVTLADAARNAWAGRVNDIRAYVNDAGTDD